MMVRWTPTACATWECAWPAASKRIIFPRRASPAAIVTDRCHRSKVRCASGERTRRHEDLRPRARAISSSKTVRAGQEIAVCRLKVKHIWTPFDDELY
jgi:hypothetical protein